MAEENYYDEWDKRHKYNFEEKVEIVDDVVYLTATGQLFEIQELYKRKQFCFDRLIAEAKAAVNYKYHGENIPKYCPNQKPKREINLILSELEKIVEDIKNAHNLIVERQQFIKKHKEKLECPKQKTSSKKPAKS